ncbi:MAG: sugar ABC transporter substrate-binding protein [Chloroflexia bacterium]|nr:sugar ABC transporter substrate-binding protein [Chloroflexia bacterium]
MKRRDYIALSAALAATPALRMAGVSAQDATPAGSPAASPAAAPTADELMTMYGPVKGAKAYKLAFMQVFPDNPFWQALRVGVEARAAENGVTVDVISLPTNSGVSDQVAQMEDAVTQGYDGIILGTIDAAGIVPGIEAANAAGIPVLAVDTAPAGGELVSLIQTDNVAASRQAGEFIVEQLGGQGKVLNLQGDMANQTAQARNAGVHKALDAAAGIETIDQSANWQQEEGLAITENILTSDPDLVAIFAANDPPALGALQALRAAGRDDVIIVGFDAIPDAVQAIIDGEMTATIAQFPAVMGTVGVDLMVRHLNGEEVPELVDSGAMLVTQENAEAFQQEQAG